MCKCESTQRSKLQFLIFPTSYGIPFCHYSAMSPMIKVDVIKQSYIQKNRGNGLLEKKMTKRDMATGSGKVVKNGIFLSDIFFD